MQKAEPYVCNLKCVFLENHREEVAPTMSPTQRLEPEKDQSFLEVFVAQATSSAAPEVCQIDTPLYCSHQHSSLGGP